ncbi:MAG: TolC family protein [Spirochaetaceae bacterium]|jgi:outer membrane protein TolC|nr:TolC family protein [Spirochaetaceae bacterium]
MTSKCNVCFTFFLLCAGLCLWGEEGAGGVLTLQRALERAVERNLTLEKNALDLETARLGADNLWAQLLPSMSAGGSVGWATSFTNPPRDGNPTFGVQASVSLSLNPSLKSTMRIISLAYRSAILDYESGKRQVEIAAAKDYYKLLIERKNLDVLRDLLAQTEGQLSQSRTKFRNGFVSELDAQRSLLAVQTARFELGRAEMAAKANVQTFLSAIGYDENVEWELEDRFTIEKIDADADALIAEYLPRRPDMQSARQTLERLELQSAQKALQARAPSLSLSSSWRGTPALAAPLSDSFSVSAGISIPLDSWIPASKDDQSVKAARTDATKAKADVQETERTARLAIRTLVNNLSSAWSSVEIARLRVDIARRALEMTQIAFNNGSEEFLALQTSRNDLTGARQQLLTEELSYKNMSLDLAAALNREVNDPWTAYTTN